MNHDSFPTVPIQPIGLLADFVSYEQTRAPFPRERKQFKDFKGTAPHLRQGPRMSLNPSLSAAEIVSIRAIITHLLAREYGMSIRDIVQILRCEEAAYVERLLAVGDELAVDSAVVARMKDIVRRAAKMIVVEVAPMEEATKVRAMLQPPGKRERKPKPPGPRKNLGIAEAAQVRCMIAYFLGDEFKFKKANIRPLFGYPTGGQIRSMQIKGEHLLRRSDTSAEGQRMLTSARAIVVKAAAEKKN